MVLLAANLFLGAKIYSSADKGDKDSPYDNLQLITRVMELIKQDYVDGEKLSYKDLSYAALRGMLTSLDPHSQFMDPENFKSMRDDTEGQFGGLGIQIGMKENLITVIAPMEDTPAFKAGILAGDQIIKIEDKSTERMQLEDAVKKLRGKVGTKITITVLRPKTKEVKDFTITREIINVASVKDINGKQEYPLLEDKIGYVRLLQFNEPTSDEFEKALEKLEAKGMQALILDLRNNPGGLLDTAKTVVGKFVPRGELIVFTEGRDKRQRIEYRAQGGQKHPDYPMVVLINGGSASASEIVSGALQDLKRAIIVGETSFGKGSVQSILPLTGDPEGPALRLTTAKYYTPSKKVIHENGITPDIIVPLSMEEERKLAMQRGNVDYDESEDGEKPKEKEKPIEDVQLHRAIDVIKGIKIYTGLVKPAAAAPSPAPSASSKP
ncbi:MAG: S41 family peptidase [Verrucomicrobiae bacterium]|nr:S41 family peptidase [Verrucomicrobiae bacterium]